MSAYALYALEQVQVNGDDSDGVGESVEQHRGSDKAIPTHHPKESSMQKVLDKGCCASPAKRRARLADARYFWV